MGTKAQKTESTENFISAWREEESLWNVTLTVYKNKDAKAKSTRILMGKCTMEGLYFYILDTKAYQNNLIYIIIYSWIEYHNECYFVIKT